MPPLTEALRIVRSDGLTPGNVSQLASIGERGFHGDPTTSWFVAWGLFTRLSHLWDDPQAVPTASVQPFQDELTEPLREWLENGVSFGSAKKRDAVVGAFHRAHSSLPP